MILHNIAKTRNQPDFPGEDEFDFYDGSDFDPMVPGDGKVYRDWIVQKYFS